MARSTIWSPGAKPTSPFATRPARRSRNATGFDPNGDNYLSVRDAPSDKVKERDRIGQGHKVHVCAESNGWYGIVYDIEGDSGIDCETGSPVDKPRNYTGPCAQGWVSKKYVKITAG